MDWRDVMQPVCKLADLGLACALPRPDSSALAGRGTLWWMAPELFPAQPGGAECGGFPVGPRVDVYSFGVVIWEASLCPDPGNFALPRCGSLRCFPALCRGPRWASFPEKPVWQLVSPWRKDAIRACLNSSLSLRGPRRLSALLRASRTTLYRVVLASALSSVCVCAFRRY